MKICVAICEFNPLHNGHVKFLNNCRELTGCDTVIAVMSGNFTQRGDVAAMNKQTRSRHAVLSGADAVIELPAVFATAPSELFCKGAINIMKHIPQAETLCFGSELGKADSFIEAAAFFNDEPKDYRKNVKQLLDKGESLSKARHDALLGGEHEKYAELLSSPNNILGLEYTKALMGKDGKMQASVVTYKREGDYNGKSLGENGISSSAARECIVNGNKKALAKFIPDYVLKDLPETLPDAGDLIFYSLIMKDRQELKNITDCGEGLENRIKNLLKTSENFSLLLNAIKTKRYPMSRIKRIALASLLGIDGELVREAAVKKPYLKVLAVKKDRSDILTLLGQSAAPLITRKSDADKLGKFHAKCFEKDVIAGDIYGLITKRKTNEYFMQIIE